MISKNRELLVTSVISALGLLHWKDFETLIDMLFRQSGWRRNSSVGKTMKFVDIELEDPIAKDLYQVQVKSSASLNDFREYEEAFGESDFRKLYFVVHTPHINLIDVVPSKDNVELLLPRRISEMVVDLGLLHWLMHKIK